MTFDTRIVDLSSGPVNLAADAEFAEQALFVQNIGRGIVYTAERGTEPSTTDNGHKIAPCATLVIELEAGDSLWIWARSTGSVAISPAGS